MEKKLTPQQARVLETVKRYYVHAGEPATASYVGRQLELSNQRVGEHFRRLHELGWLRAPGSPAVPTSTE